MATLGTWGVAATLALLVLVTQVVGQSRDRRPLIRPRQEVVSRSADYEEPVAPDGSFISHRTFSPSQQLSGNETYSGGNPSDRDGGIVEGGSEYAEPRLTAGTSGGRGGSSGSDSGISGGGRQYSSAGRQYGGGRRGGRRRGGGGGGARQDGSGSGGGRQYGASDTGSRQPDESYTPSFRDTSGGSSNSGGGVTDIDIARRQMDTTILLLQRLSDRLTAIETLQNQRAERIDAINYRLTKIELQAEERKGVLSELSGALRHRMETTDNELDRVVTLLDDLKTSVSGLSQQHTDLRASVSELPQTPEDGGAQNIGVRFQAVMATLYGLRTATQTIKEDLAQFRENITGLANITNHLDKMQEDMVTKQYLLQNINEIKEQSSSLDLPVLSQMMLLMNQQQQQPKTGRRGGSGSQGKRRPEPEDCWKLLRQGKNKSGVYSIQPRYSPVPFFVYCDMETDGGGWTVLQRREDGTVDFLREWAEYKHGFGNLAGEFWLGNEKIHLLTNQHVSMLRVDLADFDQQGGHALYSAFAVGSELEGYSLKLLGSYRGDLGDSLRYHVGRRFSTIDIDNDAWPDKSCARDHQGAWWYRACETCNLNGRYLHGPVPAEHQYTGVYWYDFRGPQYSLWKSRMMIRRGGSVETPIFKDFTEVQNATSTLR